MLSLHRDLISLRSYDFVKLSQSGTNFVNIGSMQGWISIYILKSPSPCFILPVHVWCLSSLSISFLFIYPSILLSIHIFLIKYRIVSLCTIYLLTFCQLIPSVNICIVMLIMLKITMVNNNNNNESNKTSSSLLLLSLILNVAILYVMFVSVYIYVPLW